MFQNWKTRAALAAMAAVGLWCLSTSWAKPPGGGKTGPSYQIVELDSVDGLFAGGAEGINNAGLIVGSVYDPVAGEYRAACWTLDSSTGVLTSTLHFLAGGSAAFDVNDGGEIVGERDGAAVYWRHRGAAAILLPADGAFNAASKAIAINEDGVICGWAREPEGVSGNLQVAVVWRVNIDPADDSASVHGPVVLPQFSPDHHYAAAISDNFAGDALVAGGSFGGEVALARSWVVRSNPDGSLAVIDGPTTLDVGSGQGVNNGGLICGHTAGEAAVWDTLTGARQILDRSGTTITSGGRTTFRSAQANTINSTGLVAGYATAKATFLNPVAVVWPSPTEPMVVLDKFLKNTSISELNFAWAVNDSGYVVGSGWNGDSRMNVGFLAVPK
jgi:hypothetical protein